MLRRRLTLTINIMRNLILFFAFFIAICGVVFGNPIQVTEVDPATTLEVSFVAMLSFFSKAVLAQIIVMAVEAKKWIGSGMWSWSVFWKTNIGPFLLNLGGGILIYLAMAYIPWIKNLLEALAGQEITEYTAAAFMGLSHLILKGFVRPTKQAY